MRCSSLFNCCMCFCLLLLFLGKKCEGTCIFVKGRMAVESDNSDLFNYTPISFKHSLNLLNNIYVLFCPCKLYFIPKTVASVAHSNKVIRFKMFTSQVPFEENQVNLITLCVNKNLFFSYTSF